jgi:hypothetical protein
MAPITEREAHLISLLRRRTDLGHLSMTRTHRGFQANHRPLGKDGYQCEIEQDPVEALIAVLGRGKFETEAEFEARIGVRTSKFVGTGETVRYFYHPESDSLFTLLADDPGIEKLDPLCDEIDFDQYELLKARQRQGHSDDPALDTALVEDAVKLEALGADPGPTLDDIDDLLG